MRVVGLRLRRVGEGERFRNGQLRRESPLRNFRGETVHCTIIETLVNLIFINKWEKQVYFFSFSKIPILT